MTDIRLKVATWLATKAMELATKIAPKEYSFFVGVKETRS